MRFGTKAFLSAFLILCTTLLASSIQAAEDPLPSWNDGEAKRGIIRFVTEAVQEGGPNYVAPHDRIATFDQDGTLWVEHPLYTQAMFALDRVKALAPGHPEWSATEPFKSIITGDRAGIANFGEHDWVQIIGVTHSGMDTEVFLSLAKDWLAASKHPRFHRPYTELIYQPMVEVIKYFQANGFRTYIVTGGGQEFVRSYSEKVYGIPAQDVVGSSIVTKYEYKDGQPVLMRMPKVFFVDDHAGKAVGINLFIGKRPYAAFGNSDGDREMFVRGIGSAVQCQDDPRRRNHHRGDSDDREAHARSHPHIERAALDSGDVSRDGGGSGWATDI